MFLFDNSLDSCKYLRRHRVSAVDCVDRDQLVIRAEVITSFHFFKGALQTTLINQYLLKVRSVTSVISGLNR